MDIQSVLSGTGIPTFPGTWVASYDGEMPPAQYIVHNYARAPDASAGDEVTEIATYAYVNLYSDTSPTAAIALIRAAAQTAGWGTIDERSNYDGDNKCYMTNWTFVAQEAV